MESLTRNPCRSPKAIALVIAVTLLGSPAAALPASQEAPHGMIYRIANGTNNSPPQAERLLAIEQGLNDATINFGKQIQEWKDLLLRADNEQRYKTHLNAFMEAGNAVQNALLQTTAAMQAIGLDTEGLDQLTTEHKALVSKYLLALKQLDLQYPETSHLVDQQAIGMDRDFQRHLAVVRADVEFLVRQQLTGTAPARATQYPMQYLLPGLAAALLFIALIAFAFARDNSGRKERLH